jgi:manganese/zinc/iron transport system permease protein
MFGMLSEALLLEGGYNSIIVMIGLGLLGAAAGPIGTFMILKGRPLLADAVAHATLPGIAAGFLIALILTGDGRNPVFLLSGATFAGVAAAGVMHLLKDGSRIGEDAATAATLSVSFGIGVVLLSLIQTLPTAGQAGLNAYLLGQAATMTQKEAWIVAVVGLCSLIILLVFFKELALSAFDPIGSTALGLPVRSLDLLTTALMLLLVASGLRAVGLILILALLVTPAAAARYWTDSLPRVALLSALFGGAGAYLGGGISAATSGLPTGALIVVIMSVLFTISVLFAPKRGVIAIAVRRQRLSRNLKYLRALGRIADGVALAELLKIARRRGWADPEGRPTPAGESAAKSWAEEERLRSLYLDDRPEEASRIGGSLLPLKRLLPRDVIADLERRSV